ITGTSTGSGYEGIYVSSSSIALGAGNNVIQATGATGLYLDSGSLITGAGNDNLTATGVEGIGLRFDEGSLDLGNGTNTIVATGTTAGIDFNSGTINTGSGSDRINATATGASGHGINMLRGGISTGSGNDIVNAVSAGSGYGLQLSGEPGTTAMIDLGHGDNLLMATSTSGDGALLTQGGILAGSQNDQLNFSSSSGFGLVFGAGGAIDTGTGNDRVAILSSALGIKVLAGTAGINPSINLGFGDDTFVGGRYTDDDKTDDLDLIIAGGLGRDRVLLSDVTYVISQATGARTGMVSLTDAASGSTLYLNSFELITGGNGLGLQSIDPLAAASRTLQVFGGAMTVV
ncbi:MAG: hypothetical protein ACKOPN_08815, partial [Prochlorococcaceae cyanobacterium]